MEDYDKLNIGDASSDLRLQIVDKDRLCYLVKTESRGVSWIRTISKKLLGEFIDYCRRHPDKSSSEARDALCGNSDLDKFEYGYNATLFRMAQMVLHPESECVQSDVQVVERIQKPPKTDELPLQQIFYGAPGTGKSYYINKETQQAKVFRTTFHPDTDYSTFVGSYKPTTLKQVIRDERGSVSEQSYCRSQIVYDFVAQSFLQAYVEAWRRFNETDEAHRRVFLVIEEINWGNCAQIFGDLFQLLDRNASGFSDYPIHADADMQQYLQKQFASLEWGKG